MIKNIFLITFLLSLLSPTSFSDTIYVSTLGKNSNQGTKASPVRSLSKALDIVSQKKDHHIIEIFGGVYKERLKFHERKGTPLSLIIRPVKREDGSYEEVTFDGSKTLVDHNIQVVDQSLNLYSVHFHISKSFRSSIWNHLTKKRYTLVADEVATRALPGSYCFSKGSKVFFHLLDGENYQDLKASIHKHAFYLEWPNVTIDSIRFENYILEANSQAILLAGENQKVINCYISNCQRGVSIGFEAKNAWIENCHIENVTTGVKSFGQNTSIINNKVLRFYHGFETQNRTQNQSGIQFYYPAKRGHVKNNLVVGFNLGIFVKSYRENYRVENNTVIAPPDGGEDGIGQTKYHPSLIYRNNIVYGYKVALHSFNLRKTSSFGLFENNVFWYEGDQSQILKDIDKIKSSQAGKNNILSDPLFVNPDTLDFRLLPQSPCLNLGNLKEKAGSMQALEEIDGSIDQIPPRLKLKLLSSVSYNNERELWDTYLKYVKLKLIAIDNRSIASKISYQLSEKEWIEEDNLEKQIEFPLKKVGETLNIKFRVSDTSGLWSNTASLKIRRLREKIKVIKKPVLIKNKYGATISFQTSHPAHPVVMWGTKGQERIHAQKLSAFEDTKENASEKHVFHWINTKQVNKRFYYKVFSSDKQISKPIFTGSFKFTGEPMTHHLSNEGEDHQELSSPEKPWKNIQFAVNRLLPGDTLTISPGFYQKGFYLKQSGLKEAPITIKGEGAVVIDGQKKENILIQLANTEYINLENLEIRWFRKCGINIQVSKYITLSKLKIWNNLWKKGRKSGNGIVCKGLENISIHHCLLFALNSAISLRNCEGQNSIFNNTITQILHNAIVLVYSNASIYRNSLTYTGNYHYALHLLKEQFKSLKIYENNIAQFMRKQSLGSATTFQKNFKANKGDFFRNGSKGLASISKEQYKFKGNMINLDMWKNTMKKDQNSIYAKPQYVDPENRDFHLKPSSPNIRKGYFIGALGPMPQKNHLGE